MKSWARRTLAAAVLTAATLTLTPSAALADTHNNGILNGNHFYLPVTITTTVTGNQISLLGGLLG